MRIAITADLHWGHNHPGDEATRQMVGLLQANPPDVFLLGGDIGTNEHFEACLQLFDGLTCQKGLVPGNHDIWVSTDDPRGDSLRLYEHHLPEISARHNFRYLDRDPLILPEAQLAIVGSINWYNYSWSIEKMKAEIPDWEWRLKNKAFTRGRHNDGRFVRWPLDDAGFTSRVVTQLESQLIQALSHVESALVMTHHPAFRGISFPRPEPVGLDGLLWEALSGNTQIEAALTSHIQRIPLIFSGHTHRATEASLESARGINIGGDYHFKRMLMIDWPAGTIEPHTFGDPNKRR